MVFVGVKNQLLLRLLPVRADHKQSLAFLFQLGSDLPELQLQGRDPVRFLDAEALQPCHLQVDTQCRTRHRHRLGQVRTVGKIVGHAGLDLFLRQPHPTRQKFCEDTYLLHDADNGPIALKGLVLQPFQLHYGLPGQGHHAVPIASSRPV